MMKSKILFIVVLLSFFACKKTDASSDYEEESSDSYQEETEAYPDGTYCAAIDYYNPNTGTQSTYTLNVEVENNEVTVIHWPNGGWLDSSHFSPEQLDSNGSCSYISFEGQQYDIQITGSECSYTDNVVEDETGNDNEYLYNTNEAEEGLNTEEE